jgi:hypothetical protein
MKKDLSISEKVIYAYRKYVNYSYSNKKIRALYWKLKYKYYEKQELEVFS